jgi:hypothetical protein
MAYKGGKRDKAKLRYEKEVYTPEGAKSLSDKELRQEYTRLRSIAQKRLKRFEGTEWTDTQIYKLNVGVYKPLKEIKNNYELRHLFSTLGRFVVSRDSSVSALEKERREGVKTMNERGYDFITKENYRKFMNFMEDVRVANLNRLYDSKRVAEFYEAQERKELSSRQMATAFRSWSRKQRKLKKIQNVNPRTSSQYRKDVDD